MLFANHVKILRTIYTILITGIFIVISIYNVSTIGFTYTRTIHRVSVYMPLTPLEATPFIVFTFSLISIPLSYILYKSIRGYNIILFLTVILDLVSLLNVFFEYFSPSILLLSLLILCILYVVNTNIDEILMIFALLSIATIALYVLSMMKISHIGFLASISELDISFWTLMRPTTPIIYLLILLSPLWRKTLSSLIRFQEKYQNTEHIQINKKVELIAIAIGIFLSIIFYVLPYTSILNPHRVIVTTDIVIYLARLNEMEMQNPIEVALKYPDRSLYLLLLYGLKKIFNCDSVVIATISGWMWSVLLVIAVWFLARELFDRETAIISAILTPLSHQMLSFIYGGFHANHFTLSLLYITMALLSKINLKRLIFSILILLVTSLCHTWSWVHITSSIVLYILVKIVKSRENKMIPKYYTFLLISIITIVVISEIFLHSLSYTSQFVLTGIKDINFFIRSVLSDNKLFDAFAYYLWGSLNIPLLYVLAVVAILKRKGFTILDALYVITFGYSVIFLNSIDIVSRLCINIPIQIEVANIRSLKKYATFVLMMIILLGNTIYLIYNAVPAPL